MIYILSSDFLTQLYLSRDMPNSHRVRPADNFYQFANGGWMKNNPLPAAYSRYGTFQQLVETNKQRIKAILEGLQGSSYAAGSTERKLSDLYKMAMNSGRRNQDGVQPLMGIIAQL